MITRRNVLIGGLMSPFISPSARAEGTITELELCLLFDYSSSMSSAVNDRSGSSTISHGFIQKFGHIDALCSPEISEMLIQRGALVRVITWNTIAKEVCSVLVTDKNALNTLIRNIQNKVSPGGEGSTLHNVGIDFVLSTPSRGVRRVIDISTDEVIGGREQRGACRLSRKRAIEQKVQINVLTIGILEADLATFEGELCTEDGFIYPIYDWHSYAKAIYEKLRREIA